MKPKVLVDICRILIHGGISASHGDPALLGMTSLPLACHTVLFKHTAPNLYDYRLKVCKIVYQPRY